MPRICDGLDCKRPIHQLSKLSVSNADFSFFDNAFLIGSFAVAVGAGFLGEGRRALPGGKIAPFAEFEIVAFGQTRVVPGRFDAARLRLAVAG